MSADTRDETLATVCACGERRGHHAAKDDACPLNPGAPLGQEKYHPVFKFRAAAPSATPSETLTDEERAEIAVEPPDDDCDVDYVAVHESVGERFRERHNRTVAALNAALSAPASVQSDEPPDTESTHRANGTPEAVRTDEAGSSALSPLSERESVRASAVDSASRSPAPTPPDQTTKCAREGCGHERALHYYRHKTECAAWVDSATTSHKCLCAAFVEPAPAPMTNEPSDLSHSGTQPTPEGYCEMEGDSTSLYCLTHRVGFRRDAPTPETCRDTTWANPKWMASWRLTRAERANAAPLSVSTQEETPPPFDIRRALIGLRSHALMQGQCGANGSHTQEKDYQSFADQQQAIIHGVFTSLTATVARLTLELSEARKDSERLEWLASWSTSFTPAVGEEDNEAAPRTEGHVYFCWDMPGTIREAIDAAAVNPDWADAIRRRQSEKAHRPHPLQRDDAMSETTTVGDQFPIEQARVRELLVEYTKIGVNGAFGAAMLRGVLYRADRAMASGDIVAIVQSFEEMRGCE